MATKTIVLTIVVLFLQAKEARSQCTPACTATVEECIDNACYCTGDLGGADCGQTCPTTCDPNQACTGTTCSACSPGCEAIFETCASTGTAAECRCSDGYTGTDCKTCSSDAGCNDDGTCTSGICTCNEGFAGTYCQHACPACVNGVCEENGAGTAAICDCTGTDHVGQTCQLACPDCKNDGTCIEGTGAAVCDCTTGWGGDTCEQMTCDDNADCLNGGTCDTVCTCAPGWTGDTCAVAECTVPADCNNQGTCDGGICTCNDEYIGDVCEIECPLCVNGGECVENGDGTAAICDCTGIDYVGDTCQLACNCQNGGTCKEEAGAAVCECTPQWTGDTCDTEVLSCTSGTCQNGGTCTDAENTYTCSCTPEYTGDNCETLKCDPAGNCDAANGECQGGICFCLADKVGVDCAKKKKVPTATLR